MLIRSKMGLSVSERFSIEISSLYRNLPMRKAILIVQNLKRFNQHSKNQMMIVNIANSSWKMMKMVTTLAFMSLRKLQLNQAIVITTA